MLPPIKFEFRRPTSLAEDNFKKIRNIVPERVTGHGIVERKVPVWIDSVGLCVLQAKVESENLPRPLVVEDDTLRRDVAVQKLDAVVEERQPFAQLEKAVLDLNVKELKIESQNCVNSSDL